MGIKELHEIFSRHSYVCNDTRKISEGCIYWAIRGERFDGNVFTKEALEKGAAFAVIDNPEYYVDNRCILVDNCLVALQDLASYHRVQLGLPIIAIGGSNGKTTTKELAWRVLSQKHKTFATPGNFNNHIGLPLSLLQLDKTYEIAILELGANHLNETRELAEICKPDMGLVTNIGKDHLDGFGGIEGVERANMELYDYLREYGGLVFANIDDTRIVKHLHGLKTVQYSIEDSKADVFGKIITRFPFMEAEISGKMLEKPVTVGSHLFGTFHLYNILAAFAIGLYQGVDEKAIKAAIESYIPQNNRSQVIKKGTNTYILDAYNANPSSMQGAVADFMDYPAHNKVLLLGDMFELGEESIAEHEAVLKMIKPYVFKEMAFAGKDFYACKDLLPSAYFFQTTDKMKEWYKSKNWENTVFLLKGSRGMKVEEVVV